MKSIGDTGLTIAAIGLGCVTFGREIDEAASFRLLDYAVERGITLLDTAETYGGGQARSYRRSALGIDDIREVSAEMHSSEKIIGRWLHANGCRSGVMLQTKVSSGYTADAVRAAIEGSLERLQTDCIDFYLLHKLDAATRVRECLESIGAAIRAKRIGAAGCSNVSAAALREAIELSGASDLPRFEVVQPAYSLVDRSIEKDLLPFCKGEGIAVIPYSPLAAGFLSGKYTADRAAFPHGSRFHVSPGHADVYFSDRNFQIVQRLHAFAERVGVPAVRLAVAWALRNPDITAVLIGARNTDHIDNAIAARDMEIPEAWMAEMNAF
jgi:aryl-alcohol dehydrogenase-like predicted oxidoreductase